MVAASNTLTCSATQSSTSLELLMLWAKKMGILPFEADELAAAKTTLDDAQPMEARMHKPMDADEAVFLPAKDLLKRLAPILEQRLAEAIESGSDSWTPNFDLHDEALECVKIPLVNDDKLDDDSIPDKKKWAWAYDFVYVSLRKSGGLDPSVRVNGKDGNQEEHRFYPFERKYPADVRPELPGFPSFLSLIAAIGVYVHKVKALRNINGWQGVFEPHHDVAMRVGGDSCTSGSAPSGSGERLQQSQSSHGSSNDGGQGAAAGAESSGSGSSSGVAVRAAMAKGARPQKSGRLDLSSREHPPGSISLSKTSLTRRGSRCSTYCSVGRTSTTPVATRLASCLSRTRPSTRPTTLRDTLYSHLSSSPSSLLLRRRESADHPGEPSAFRPAARVRIDQPLAPIILVVRLPTPQPHQGPPAHQRQTAVRIADLR